MTALQRAKARQKMWEDRWIAGGRVCQGPVWRAYSRADAAYVTLISEGIRKRNEHVGHEHRKSLSIDHDPACPVFSEGLTNDKCECHYSDARCTE